MCFTVLILMLFRSVITMMSYSGVSVIVIAVVKVTVMLSDIADWPAVNTVYQKCTYLVAF